MKKSLKEPLEKVIELHQEDLERGYSGCFLFDSIEAKYKMQPRSWCGKPGLAYSNMNWIPVFTGMTRNNNSINC
jgi:hypothetical protein